MYWPGLGGRATGTRSATIACGVEAPLEFPHDFPPRWLFAKLLGDPRPDVAGEARPLLLLFPEISPAAVLFPLAARSTVNPGFRAWFTATLLCAGRVVLTGACGLPDPTAGLVVITYKGRSMAGGGGEEHEKQQARRRVVARSSASSAGGIRGAASVEWGMCCVA
jgi:hypothetical protein